ncbi:hypothetical protein F751_3450 [Auxenochlorella protothecoides]|uniref:Protein NEDD1 n=1 Tax=Auxenochlorella protothecoides TaxID=3075 RepID=A0A087SC05_AUXPR|nr:hypothetical protein F751_3450 [Auxenochlorella protothecoides]KFM23259.1 hypothetical protein F751_3450 [Auxenochlorella protothecoides]
MGTGDYPAELLAGCSGTSLHLWRVSNVNSSPPVPNSHPGQQPLEVVAWNRNNKVVAGARADGSVSLSYSNGEAMSVLNRPAGSSAIVTPTALAWASGSKRLAVAGRSGAIGVHDMTNKACTTVHLPEPIAALQYHPADRFLAVCGGASATLLDRDLRPVGQLTPEPGMAPATCMHLDSSSACLTLGHADGSLNVWDLPSRRTVAASQALGRGGICSVSSPAGDPSSVYAAAKDGSVWCLVSVGEGHGVGPAGSTAPSAGAAALEDIRRRLPLAIGSRWGTEAGQDRAAATPAPQVTAREWSEGPRREAAREGGDAGSAGGAHGPRPHTSEPTSSTASANANPALQRAPSGARLSSPAKSSPGTDSGKKGADTAQEGWRIPAVARDSPPRSFRPGREAAEGPGSPDGSNESVRPMEEDSLLGTAPAQGAAAGSPLRRQPPPPLASVSRDDLLALHLDMLNQFQAQRIHMEELLKEMGSRQDQLSAELSSLRQQLGSLLTQRNDLRWL